MADRHRRPSGGNHPMSDRVTVRPVEGARDIDAFMRVPFRVHAGDPNWTPPLFFDRRRALDRRSNPYFEHAEAAYWISERHGVAIGRISALAGRLAAPDIGQFGMLVA